MSKNFKKYLFDIAERMICTFAEALLGVIGASATFGDVNWKFALSTAGLATLVSGLKCVVAYNSGNKQSGSLID